MDENRNVEVENEEIEEAKQTSGRYPWGASDTGTDTATKAVFIAVGGLIAGAGYAVGTGIKKLTTKVIIPGAKKVKEKIADMRATKNQDSADTNAKVVDENTNN